MQEKLRIQCAECKQTTILDDEALLSEARCRFCFASLNPSNVDTPFSVAPLHCDRCNAPVPIANDQPIQSCMQCGAECSLPDDHKALFQLNKRTAAQRARAAELYERIGQPPSAFTTLLSTGVTMLVLPLAGAFLWVSRIFVVIAMELARVHIALGLIALVPVALVYKGISAALHSSHRWLGFDALTVFTPFGAWALTGALLLVVIALPIGLTRHFEALVAVRARLRATLAANAPSAEGGPSSCRSCGAALAVAPGELGATCLYCQADNLVRISPREASRFSEHGRALASSIEDAAEEEAGARARAQHAVKRVLVTALTVEVLFLVGGWVEATLAGP